MSERDSERDLAAALEPYIVNIQETGKEVGSGAYATVVEASGLLQYNMCRQTTP